MGRPLAVTICLSAGAILLWAVMIGVLWPIHLLSLLAGYVLVIVAGVALVRTGRIPRTSDGLALAGAVAIVIALPLALWIGVVGSTPLYRLPHVGRLVGQWALPVALTVPFGILPGRRQRIGLAVAHAIAVLALALTGALLLSAVMTPWFGLGGLLLPHYALGVVAGYPAVVLLVYRESVESGLQKVFQNGG